MTGKFENKRTSGDQPDYSIIKIGQNTEKSTGDLRRLAVTETQVEKHQLTLIWKTLKGVMITVRVKKGRRRRSRSGHHLGLRPVSILELEEYIKKRKELIIAAGNTTGNMIRNRKNNKKLESRNGEKSCTDTSNDKLARLHTWKPRQD